MILVDANILLYAYDSSSARHAGARSWIEGTFGSDEPVGIPLASVLAFLRIGTHPAVFRRPLDPQDAIDIATGWFEHPTIDLVHPTHRHWSTLAELARAGRAKGPLMMDAHLAALALEHGATLCTTDRDFARFPGVDVVDPTEV